MERVFEPTYSVLLINGSVVKLEKITDWFRFFHLNCTSFTFTFSLNKKRAVFQIDFVSLFF